MNDERAMILKMLQEGKISVDEANALLDVLNEPEPRPEAGRRERRDSSGPRVFARVDSEDEGEDDTGIHLDIDLSGLKESLRATMGSVRETMKGVSESLKEAFSGSGEFDFVAGLGRAMGRVRSEDERELGADVGSTGSLRLANKWGDVRVTGVESDRITGTARIACWAADEESAEAAVRETVVSLEPEAGGWVLSTDLGSERGTRIDLELQVPVGLNVSVSTASGDLWIEGLTGSHNVKTMSGDINVASLGGGSGAQHLVSTKSGDVIGAALCGDITLSSLSGDIVVNGFSGVLRMTSQSGDIRVTDGRGSVQLRAMSGDVHAELLELGSEALTLASVSGDAFLLVPPDAALDVRASSTSGDVRVDLELHDATRREHRVTGRANGGGLDVEVSSVSGDVGIAPIG